MPNDATTRDEIEITHAMIEAGMRQLLLFNSLEDDHAAFAAFVYEAMEKARLEAH